MPPLMTVQQARAQRTPMVRPRMPMFEGRMPEKQPTAEAAKPAVRILEHEDDKEPEHKPSPVAADKPKIRPAKMAKASPMRKSQEKVKASQMPKVEEEEDEDEEDEDPVMSVNMYVEWRREERLARVREERLRKRRRRRPEVEVYLDRESK